jgi:hypothetical protein
VPVIVTSLEVSKKKNPKCDIQWVFKDN